MLNAGYVSWAGITAGKHGSFYDYLAGGDTWKDFFSPDHSGTPINLLAYTASFGGGFSATLSLEQNECRRLQCSRTIPARLITSPTAHSGVPLGVRAPDIVASLDVTQSWGSAHLAGVAHNVRFDVARTVLSACTASRDDLDAWGYGVIGGVTFNLPMLVGRLEDRLPGRLCPWRDRLFRRDLAGVGRAGPGLQHQRQRHVVPDGRRDRTWHDDVGVLSNAWSAAAQLTWKVSPNFEIDPEVAYANVDYGSTAARRF